MVVITALLLTSCLGYTTRATNIAKQPNGSYSAQLNFVVSCGSGEHCSWYSQYRRVGTSIWTHVPATPHGPVSGPVSNISLSEKVTGLSAGTQYEYQVCGDIQPGKPFVCVGPDDTPNTTTKFKTAAWTIQPTPSGTTLPGVSCTSATACSAVGSGGLAELWNGSTWTIQPPPGVAGTLNGVA